jgi:hypothetical protein
MPSVVLLAGALCAALLASPVPASAAPQPITVTLSGTNGVGTITTDALSCAAGGQGKYRHYTIDAPLPAGVLSHLAGQARATLDVHHDGVEPPVGPVVNDAFLLGNESHLTLSNQRGAVQLRLSSGTCGAPTLPFDGTTVGPASGTWLIDSTSPSNSGAYRQASGSGTFTLKAGVGPGADNAWTLGVNGSLSVLEPTLQATVVSTFWGNLGLDYALRNVSVTYQITNTGPGDAFATSLVATSSPTAGVKPLGPTPQPIGDLAAGQSAQVTVVYHMAKFSGPCGFVLLSCHFATKITASVPDALDVTSTQFATNQVVAPNLPPPL